MREIVVSTLFSLLPFSLAGSPAEAKRSTRRALEAFVGEWRMELVADETTFGERGGPGRGTMRCAWGLLNTWVDCELDSEYEGLGHYVLKIVLYRAGGDDACGAFVTNSFGGGRLYQGRWVDDATLVFRDAWVDPSRAWQHQRTTYSFHENGEISFSIEVSNDGESYLPHSHGAYHRR